MRKGTNNLLISGKWIYLVVLQKIKWDEQIQRKI